MNDVGLHTIDAEMLLIKLDQIHEQARERAEDERICSRVDPDVASLYLSFRTGHQPMPPGEDTLASAHACVEYRRLFPDGMWSDLEDGEEDD